VQCWLLSDKHTQVYIFGLSRIIGLIASHSQAIRALLILQIGNNLKYWGQNEEVIHRTLQLFLEMTMGCGSAKVGSRPSAVSASRRRRWLLDRTAHPRR
jgi:hypothetical protein